MTEQQKAAAHKRVYDESAASDGRRVLVERLVGRGISKERAHFDLWLKEIAPGHELRTWGLDMTRRNGRSFVVATKQS